MDLGKHGRNQLRCDTSTLEKLLMGAGVFATDIDNQR